MFETIQQQITDKTAKIGIIGLGYVGLPLARAFTQNGFCCIGYDLDEKKVESLNKGHSYIAHFPSTVVEDWKRSGQFRATADMKRLSEADALLICVPTPLSESRDPDLSYVEKTCKTIAEVLRPGQLIVLESTTYPGTTRDIMLPLLEASGLQVNKDFFLAYSPEREDPGNVDFSAEGIPKLVGGHGLLSSQVAVSLYEKAIAQIVPVSSCEVAEAAKIVENTYRSVNIAMVNELKVIFDRLDIDVWEVIEAAKTKPFGFQAFYPGPGLGGHCIPIDPFYLSWVARKAGLNTKFIELAGEINTSMPNYVVRKVMDALNDQGKALNGSAVCVLGIAYKADIDDMRESPALDLMQRLMKKGAVVTYNDPHIPLLEQDHSWNGPVMQSTELTNEFLTQQDCILVATNHSTYNWTKIVENASLVFDTRNACVDIADELKAKVYKG